MLEVPKVNRYIINAVVFILLLLLQVQSAYSQTKYLTPERLTKFLDCTKDVNGIPYPEERIFLEAQSWWTPTDPTATTVSGDTPGIHDFGHMHVGTCFPYKQTIRGNVDFEVVLTFHDYEPGTYLMNMRPHIFNPDFGAKLPLIGNPPKPVKSVSALVNFEAYPGLALKGANGLNPRIESPTNIPGTNVKGFDIGTLCENQGVDNINTIAGDTIRTCKLGLKFTMDTRQAPLDGLQEFRFITVRREPDGREMHVSTGWQARLDNGDDEVPISRPGTMQDTTRDVSDYYHKFIEGKGWYTGSNYISDRVFDDPNYGGITNHPMPSNPIEVSEEWHPTVQTNNGAGAGARISNSQIFINPNFHDTDPDNPLNGASVGPASLDKIMGMNELTITTNTTGVVHGYNRLVVRVDADCDLDGHNDLDNNGVDDPSIDINSSGIRSDDCQCDDPKAQGVCNAVPLPANEFAGQRSTGIIVVPFYVNKPSATDELPEITFNPFNTTGFPTDYPRDVVVTVKDAGINAGIKNNDGVKISPSTTAGHGPLVCDYSNLLDVTCDVTITSAGRLKINATDSSGQIQYRGSTYIVDNNATDELPEITFNPFNTTGFPTDYPRDVVVTVKDAGINAGIKNNDGVKISPSTTAGHGPLVCDYSNLLDVTCDVTITSAGRLKINATDSSGQIQYRGSTYIHN